MPRKAKAIVDQGIQALGGPTYLTSATASNRDAATASIPDGHRKRRRVSGASSEFPDKERVELTKERDIAELYVGIRDMRLPTRGRIPSRKKDLDDYLRRRRFSLDTVSADLGERSHASFIV
jgi:hypothetical protein